MNVTLTDQEWNTLLNAAAMAPYKDIAPLLSKITSQLTQQLQAAAVGTPEEKDGD